MSTTGNSSGSIAIASVRPASTLAEPVAAQQRSSASTIATHSASADGRDQLARCARSRARARSCPASSAASDAPMRPSSVRGPVATTSRAALPLDHQRAGEHAGRRRARFATGSDSPVSSDSSSIELVRRDAAARRPARGRPRASSSRSPRTTSAPAMRSRSPSRTTSARGLDRSRSASSARSALALLHDGDRRSPRRSTRRAPAPRARRRARGRCAAAADQQQEHRLAHHARRDRQRAAPLGAGQAVRAFRGEARRGLGRRESAGGQARDGIRNPARVSARR